VEDKVKSLRICQRLILKEISTQVLNKLKISQTVLLIRLLASTLDKAHKCVIITIKTWYSILTRSSKTLQETFHKPAKIERMMISRTKNSFKRAHLKRESTMLLVTKKKASELSLSLTKILSRTWLLHCGEIHNMTSCLWCLRMIHNGS